MCDALKLHKHALAFFFMLTPKLFHHISRLRRISASASSSLTTLSRSLLSSSHAPKTTTTVYQPSQPPGFILNETSISTPFSNFTTSRSFSINAPSTGGSENDRFDIEEEIKTESDNLENLSLYDDDSQVADGVFNEISGEWYDSFIDRIIWGLDNYHDFTGLPWWLVIASSTLALRTVLLPVLILQLKKMKRFGELLPKLPPPIPPPLSGNSHLEQFLLFWKKKKEIGCPSSFWILASASVQVPSFFLLMASIRRMSLDCHPGFDCGGILWFHNLTESPDGVLAPIFPILIAGSHFINVQISLQTSTVRKETALVSSLKKYYKHMLNCMSIPIFIVGFWIPQGSLVYWFTSNLLTVSQQIYLGHPAVLEKLGLSSSSTLPTSENIRAVQNLSPDGLLSLSLQLLADGHKDRAVQLLRSALDKDPEYVRGLVVLGQTLMQQEELVEASEYLERAISKLFVSGHPTNGEEITLLILASSWAGLACIHQGKIEKGLEHLKRIPQLQEPQDPKGKGHYYEGFVLLASALLNLGLKNEAAEYVRRAAGYYPVYNEYLQQCLEDEDNNVTSAKR